MIKQHISQPSDHYYVKFLLVFTVKVVLCFYTRVFGWSRTEQWMLYSSVTLSFLWFPIPCCCPFSILVSSLSRSLHTCLSRTRFFFCTLYIHFCTTDYIRAHLMVGSKSIVHCLQVTNFNSALTLGWGVQCHLEVRSNCVSKPING